MDMKSALQEQYHASLAMLADCVVKCPEEIWTSGKSPRTFWRIVFHTTFFAHLYLGQDLAACQPWQACPERFKVLWSKEADCEPYELPEELDPLTHQEALDYISYIDSLIDPTIDGLELSATETGFWWYKEMGKLSHELMSLRHIQGHIGQLSELLMMDDIDTDWIGKAARISL